MTRQPIHSFIYERLILAPRLNVITFFYDLRLKAPVLKMFLNLLGTQYFNKSKLRKYEVNYIDNTWDFVSPDDFDDVQVILEQF